MGQKYKCKDCSYEGPLIIEANKELVEEIKENYKKRKEG
ncbi:MAG: Zn finger protein C2C2 type [Candidatus Methanohalarchaeum thermophilum]|uniref:Zn finger protein C2C2 type n=1 Tax=Methanohalarchaeum thermophilum TaxID=1903181 RepID=A0A1Q6DV33_METT1|nr:MAG: Zn finger protein C2C2 type [Candidatus Methanohalarchaeum thermophilum]